MKYAKVLAANLKITEAEAQGRIVAEMMRNSDENFSVGTGGIHDYKVREIIGCQNLNCSGSKKDPNYSNEDYNKEYSDKNSLLYGMGLNQLGLGQTANDLVISNVKNNPVSTTIAGAGMVGLGFVTGGASLAPVNAMIAGGSLGGGVNATVQYLATGKIDYVDVAIGTATGALGAGTTLIPSMIMNSGGALTAAGYKGENPNSGMGSAVVATGIGYGVGKVIEIKLDTIYNPVFRQEWYQLGNGLSTYIPPSVIPANMATMFSGFAQEYTGDKTKNRLESQ